MQLTHEQIHALTELFDQGVGAAAQTMNLMLRSHLRIHVSPAQLIAPSDGHIMSLGQDQVSCIQLRFKGPFSGTAALVFPIDSASRLVTEITGEESAANDLDAVRMETLNEIGNIILNGVMSTVANFLESPLSYTLPSYRESGINDLLSGGHESIPQALIVLVESKFYVGELETAGDILLVFGVGSFDALLQALDNRRPSLESGASR